MNAATPEQLLTQRDPHLREAWIRAHYTEIDDTFVEALKNASIQRRMSDPDHAFEIARLIDEIARLTGVPTHHGYSLWAEAVVTSLGIGDYARALTLYDRAIALFAAAGDTVSPAIMQVSRLWSLANLNRIDEALEVGESAAAVLRSHGRWLPLATLQMNVASVYTRRGEYGKALAMYEEQRHSYESFGLDDPEIASLWALAEHNRAISLCYLGRFAESIEAGRLALATQERLGNHQEAARVLQHLAVTYAIMGRYNEALRMFEQARSVFAQASLHRHAARVDLYICECWLRLRRFDLVIQQIPEIQKAFLVAGAAHEQGIATLYAAIAHSGSGDNDAALRALTAARTIFADEDSAVWIAHCDLQLAYVYAEMSDDRACLAAARAASVEFQAEEQPVKAVESLVVAARALARLERYSDAQEELAHAAVIGSGQEAPEMVYRLHAAQGELAHLEGDLERCFAELETAIYAVERLRSHLMIDLRVNFQEDKQVLYEQIVEVSLAKNAAETALHYADRAKSRTLVELLDGRIRVRLQARTDADQPLVDELTSLRSRREQLYWHRQNREGGMERALAASLGPDEQRELQQLERQIADLWGKLLVRNAEYAEDANVQEVDTRPLDLELEPGALLLEYFAVRDRLLVFVVRDGCVEARWLDTNLGAIRRLAERLHQHMRSVHLFPAARISDLIQPVNRLLHQLYAAVLAPLQDVLESAARLIVAPHDVLHYLPFHAMHDGRGYLVERWMVSYVPNATLLHIGRTRPTSGSGLTAIGFSGDGALPYTIAEANSVAQATGGMAVLEADATRARSADAIRNRQIVHFATHGEFRNDEPLFSGLLLADGWLTTLDVFDLELNASLVTLSACQSGRSTLGAGDELLGLTRSFMHAGANALLISMWSVEDRSTAQWMSRFYQQLESGCDKAEAVRQVQVSFLTDNPSTPNYTHPYYWAPFFLVGDVAPIRSDAARHPGS